MSYSSAEWLQWATSVLEILGEDLPDSESELRRLIEHEVKMLVKVETELTRLLLSVVLETGVE